MATELQSAVRSLLTPEDLSERIGVAVTTLENWRYIPGAGPLAVKMTVGRGGGIRYRLADVEKWESELPVINPSIAKDVEAAYDGL